MSKEQRDLLNEIDDKQLMRVMLAIALAFALNGLFVFGFAWSLAGL